MKTTIELLTITVGGLLVASCANNSVIESSVGESVSKVEIKPGIEHKSSCESLVRNLTLPWQASQSGCEDDRIVTKPLVDVEKLKEIQKLELYKKRNAFLAKKRKERENVAVLYQANELLNNPLEEKVVIQKNKSIENKVVSKSGAHSKYIWFAKHIRILGPQGSASTMALIPGISRSEERVLLRGFYLEEELDDYDPEVFSVARALAVKKKLIEEGDIDPERITILHHSPKINARYVEVNING